MKNINFEQYGCDKTLPEQYYPDVEYPTNAYFYKTGDCNAMLGPFADDVKSSYRTLLEKNREAFEELKTKYMNDISLNNINCIKENTEPILTVETIEEAVTTFEEVDDETDEGVNESISEKEVESTVEDIVIEENELIETTIESEDDISDDEEYFEPETEVVEDNNEEVMAENNFQSWESEQFF